MTAKNDVTQQYESWANSYDNDKVEIIRKDVGIELKLVSSPSQFPSLQGQLFNYAQEFQKIYCWLYDCSKSIKPRDLNLFKNNLKKMNLDNVEVIMRP